MSADTKIGLTGLLNVGFGFIVAIILISEPEAYNLLTDQSTGQAEATNDPWFPQEKPPRSTEVQEQEETAGVEKVLIPEKSSVLIHGRILDTDGNPLKGVSIAEATSSRGEEYWIQQREWRDTGKKTGPDGRFTIVLSKSTFLKTYLQFEHPNHHEAQVSLLNAVPIHDGSFILNDIELRPAISISIVIRGRVVDKRGEPVAECKIKLGRVPWDSRGPQFRQGARLIETEDLFELIQRDGLYELVRKAVFTDNEGRFKLTKRRNHTERVWAYEKGYGMGWGPEVNPSIDSGIPEMTIVLEQALPIQGRLLRADGSPVQRRRLWVIGNIEGVSIQQTVFTDEQGMFLFRPLPEALYEIKTERVRRPEVPYEQFQGEFALAKEVRPGAKNLEFYIPMGSRVLIHLEDEEGKPIQTKPLVSLYAEPAGKERGFAGTSNLSGLVENPEPGTFVYWEVPNGIYEIRIATDGFANHIIADIEVPPPPGVVEVSAVLKSNGTILGKVHFADGHPAPGVAIKKEEDKDRFQTLGTSRDSLYRGASWYQSFTKYGIRTRSRKGRSPDTPAVIVTDEEGTFQFEDVKRGNHHLYFRVGGWEVFKKTPVQVSDKNPRVELEIVLPDLSGSIEGVVRDSGGIPLSQACVVAWDGDELFNVTKSDEQGRYCFLGLPDGRYIVDARMITSAVSEGGGFGIGAEGKLEGLEEAFNAFIEKGAACKLDLTITELWNSAVEGHVITSDSRSIPDRVRISLTELMSDKDWRRVDPYTAADLFRYDVNHKGQRLKPGHFKYVDLRAGRYEIEVSWDNQGPRRQTVFFRNSYQTWKHHEIFFLEPSTQKELSIFLALADLQGTIVDETTGDPVRGAGIIVQNASESKSGWPVKITTGEDGAFDLKNVPAGTYHLTFLHDNYIPYYEKNFQLLDSMDRIGLRFALKRGALTVNGRLKIHENPNRLVFTNRRGPEWTVVPAITTHGADYDLGVDVDKDGSFQLKGLPPGEVKLVVFRYRRMVLEKTVFLPLPEGKHLEIEVP